MPIGDRLISNSAMRLKDGKRLPQRRGDAEEMRHSITGMESPDGECLQECGGIEVHLGKRLGVQRRRRLSRPGPTTGLQGKGEEGTVAMPDFNDFTFTSPRDKPGELADKLAGDDGFHGRAMTGCGGRGNRDVGWNLTFAGWAGGRRVGGLWRR